MSHKFLEIVHTRSLQGLPLERVYRKLRDRDLLLAAYGRLYAKKGAMTPGIDPQDTVDGMSLQRIDKIIEALKNGCYKWQPVRRKEIAKKNGKTRPLGLPSWSDKLLQEAIRRILEAYYEPKFSKHSHAYRPGRGCHTALQEVQEDWRGVKWWIKIDIKGCFDNIDHNILLDIIFRDIQDARFRKLLKEMLQAGYMKDWKYHQTYSGTPQGGVVSPILSNIILNELDKYVEDYLIPAYSRGQRRRSNPHYTKYTHLIEKAKKNGDKETYARLVAERRTLPSVDNFDPDFRRLKYIRYADDVLLGYIGPKSEAQEITSKIQDFLRTINLEASEEKTRVIHAREKVGFLGYDIYIAQDNSKLTRGITGVKKRSVNSQPTLTVPFEVRKGWLKRYSHKGKPTHRPELLNCSDYEIIQTYDAQVRGLVNYYALAVNVSKLQEVKFHFERSLARTLANKHKMSVPKIYKRYRTKGEHSIRCLTVTVKNPRNPDKPLVATFGDIPIKRKKSTIIIDEFEIVPIGKNELVRRLLANECELCGSHEQVEVHHVRALKNVQKKYPNKQDAPDWATFMMTRNRKTVVVCRKCHDQIHRGKYDGKKVN